MISSNVCSLIYSRNIRITRVTTRFVSDFKVNKEGFDDLNLIPPFTVRPVREKRDTNRTGTKIPPNPPRYKRMPVNQDWTSVWPTQRMFSPSVVPLPLYMGMIQTRKELKPRPGKFANPELMKIPNFLHVAPPAIKKHCEAIRKFCTKWPEALKTDEDCDRHFPLEVITKDYCHASPSIRDPRVRVVTIRLKISSLELDSHAKDKLKRILNERYDSNTDTITIVTDRCPLKCQNVDYAKYLLTACYFESWKTEEWETTEKERSDWERFLWEKSPSRAQLVTYFSKVYPEAKEDEILQKKEVKNYSQCVSELFDKQENDVLWQNYRNSVEKLLFAN